MPDVYHEGALARYTPAMQVKGKNPYESRGPTGEAVVDAALKIGQLKRLFRQGWLKRGVPSDRCESVADHSFAVALLALTAPCEVPFDRTRAALLALVHELGEVYAGDITPVDGVGPEEKRRRERESLARVIEGLDEQTAALLAALWEEFETGDTREARFVRQLDRLEMGMQAAVYRAEGFQRMEEFIASADRAVEDPPLRRLLHAATATTAIAAGGSA